MTRQTLRAGSLAAKQGLKLSADRRTPPRGEGGWIALVLYPEQDRMANWAGAAGARAGKCRTVQRGKRYAATVTGPQLGHAWSGGASSQAYSDGQGPDASRKMWAFAAKQFRAGA